jgi:hypothetical protein
MTSLLKKSLRAAEQQRADVARARRRWIREQGFLDPARLVFIDETAEPLLHTEALLMLSAPAVVEGDRKSLPESRRTPPPIRRRCDCGGAGSHLAYNTN